MAANRKRSCTICSESVPFLLKGRGYQIWHEDQLGRKWRGKTCPDCVDFSGEMPKSTTPKRKCRKCAAILPPSRYFNCPACVLLETDDGYDYHGGSERATEIERPAGTGENSATFAYGRSVAPNGRV